VKAGRPVDPTKKKRANFMESPQKVRKRKDKEDKVNEGTKGDSWMGRWGMMHQESFPEH